ncbi:MAG: hypothetical protein NT067_00080 [Candidatus Diapherotrites archaeon]|nr:hypothetical protein [Candidatus Diapherotrites archaeon]
MARPGRKPTGHRKSRRPPSFLWLDRPLMPAFPAPRVKPSPKRRRKSSEELQVEEREINGMVRGSYSAGEMLSELGLYDAQLLRYVKRLRAKAPESEKWRYERLLNDRKKVEAYKVNLIYDLRRAGLSWTEIEGLTGLDWGNATHYFRILKQGRLKPSTIKRLSGQIVDPNAVRTQTAKLDRERLVVQAVFQNAPLERIQEALAYAERVLPKQQGFERNRLQVAINELRRLLEKKK